jgi:hypothetical protein
MFSRVLYYRTFDANFQASIRLGSELGSPIFKWKAVLQKKRRLSDEIDGWILIYYNIYYFEFSFIFSYYFHERAITSLKLLVLESSVVYKLFGGKHEL